MFYSVNQRCYLTSSIRDFYHFDDTKDNQRFFLIARPRRVILKDVVCFPDPPSFPFWPPPPPTLNPRAPAVYAPASSVLRLQLRRQSCWCSCWQMCWSGRRYTRPGGSCGRRRLAGSVLASDDAEFTSARKWKIWQRAWKSNLGTLPSKLNEAGHWHPAGFDTWPCLRVCVYRLTVSIEPRNRSDIFTWQ